MYEPIQCRVFSTHMLRRLTCGILLLLITGMAAANKPDDITETEMKLLPRYCPDTMGFNYGDSSYNTSPRAGYWVSLMGNGFWNIHHYCWATINMSRAQKAGLPAQARRGLLESVRADYLYVINKSASNFIMLPEIYTRLGEVQLLLKEPNKANEAYARARKLKADYWPAYSQWADYLLRSGQKAEALKITIAGLQQTPDAKVLLELFRILGGKSSEFPKPIPKQQETGNATESTETPESTNPPVSSENTPETP